MRTRHGKLLGVVVAVLAATGVLAADSPDAAARRKRVDDLVLEALQLDAAGDASAAADRLREATTLDPENRVAGAMLQEHVRHLEGRNLLLPPAEGGSYQVLLPELRIDYHETQGRPASQKPPEDLFANQDTRDLLNENLREITAVSQPLGKVLNFLDDNMTLKMQVSWESLHAIGIDEATPVTVVLKDVSTAMVLTTAFSQLQTDQGAAAYAIEGGSVVVSTAADLNSARFRRQFDFDLHDLLAGFPDAAGPETPGGAATESLPRTRAEALARAMEAVMEIAPTTWETKGGKLGRIEREGDILHVGQSSENLVAIYKRLERLRDSWIFKVNVNYCVLLVDQESMVAFQAPWGDPPKPGQPEPLLRAAVIDHARELQGRLAGDRRTLATEARGLSLYAMCRSTAAANVPRPLSQASMADLGVFAEGVTSGVSLALTAAPGVSRAQLRLRVSLAEQYVVPGEAMGAAGQRSDQYALTTRAGHFDLLLPVGGAVILDGGIVPADLFVRSNQEMPAGIKRSDSRRLLVLMTFSDPGKPETGLSGAGYDRPTGLPAPEPGVTPATRPAR